MGFLGILMLDTAFPRVLGDAGNPASFPYAARTLVVADAGSLDIVRDGVPDPALVARFCAAAKQLETEGAGAIISTCGFLVQVQDQIAAAVNIPVMLSALSLYPDIRRDHRLGKIGILTASAPGLGARALAAAGINRADVAIRGMQDCPAFASAILCAKADQPQTLDTPAIGRFAVQQARSILADHPDTQAFLLECGNLPPYAKDIAKATGRPVHSILDAANRLMGKS